MIWTSITSSIFLIIFLQTSWTLGYTDDLKRLEKRQIGVLARTGALPQGKRSVEVLARNGELPVYNSPKINSFNEGLDSFVEDRGNPENVNAHKLQDRLEISKDEEDAGNWRKRSLEALARNSQFPQKRIPAEGIWKSGYLVTPLREKAPQPSDIFDPDEFLAGGQTPKVFPGSYKSYMEIGKGYPEDIGRPSYGYSFTGNRNFFCKKNLGSLARDGGFSSLKYPVKNQNWDDDFDFDDFHDDNKKNLGVFESFISKDAFGERGNRRVERGSEFRINGKNNGNRNDLFSLSQNFRDAAQFYNEDYYPLEKRFLGRIPQLGRIQQKVQSPSTRRRPHLRPNWL